jgi:hypothetical protein
MNKDDVKEKSREKVVLSRKELWLLRIAAATGVMSFLSHGIQFISQVMGWL